DGETGGHLECCDELGRGRARGRRARGGLGEFRGSAFRRVCSRAVGPGDDAAGDARATVARRVCRLVIRQGAYDHGTPVASEHRGARLVAQRDGAAYSLIGCVALLVDGDVRQVACMRPVGVLETVMIAGGVEVSTGRVEVGATRPRLVDVDTVGSRSRGG